MRAKATLAVILCTIFTLFGVAGHAAEWVLYQESPMGKHYYDKKSVQTQPTGLIDVTTRVVFSADGRKQAVNERVKRGLPTEGYADLADNQAHWTYDCRAKTWTINSGVDYGRSQKVLTSFTVDKNLQRWQEVEGNKNFEKLFAIVCPKGKK
jgi:hypothetical protein